MVYNFNSLLRGTPLGSVGPSRVNAGPSIDILNMLMRRDQFGRSLLEGQADRKAQLDLATMKLDATAAENEKMRLFESGQADKSRAFSAQENKKARKEREKEHAFAKAGREFEQRMKLKREGREAEKHKFAKERVEKEEAYEGLLSEARTGVASEAARLMDRLDATDPVTGERYQATPEQIREELMHVAGDLQGEERRAYVEAVDDWYEDAVETSARAEAREDRKETREATKEYREMVDEAKAEKREADDRKARELAADRDVDNIRFEMNDLKQDLADLREEYDFVDDPDIKKEMRDEMNAIRERLETLRTEMEEAKKAQRNVYSRGD